MICFILMTMKLILILPLSFVALRIPETRAAVDKMPNVRMFTYVFAMTNDHNLAKDENSMVVASLQSLQHHTDAAVEVLCHPASTCDQLRSLLPSVEFTPHAIQNDNWVINVELSKRSYVQKHPGKQLLWFETDMLFLQDPLQSMTAGFSEAKARCDTILGYGKGTTAGLNTGLVFYYSDVGALRLLNQTIDGLLSIRHPQGGENQKIIADLGFQDIKPEHQRTQDGMTVCSKHLEALQLYSIYSWGEAHRNPHTICEEALKRNVSLIHFNGPKHTKYLLQPTCNFCKNKKYLPAS